MSGLDPQALAMFSRGVAALEASDYNTAERMFGSIVAMNPRAHEAWNALSVVAVRGGEPQVAAARARQALQLDRRNAVYMNSLGVACGELRDFPAAEVEFRRALKHKPVFPEALYNLGKVLHKQDRPGESIKAFERAYAMDPDYPGLRLSLADAYRMHGRADRALMILREARAASESLVSPHAECIAEAEGPESAIRWLRLQTDTHPDWRDPRFALGLMLLARGQWREGWQGYHWRPGLAPREAPRRVEGKRVLLLGEQGLGDVLFFLRFARRLRQLGARTALHCPPPLASLLQSTDVVDELVQSPDAPGFDLRLWCGDLPEALDTSDTPGAVPLRCDKAILDRVAQRLGVLGPAPYLGLTWRAGTDMLRGQEFVQERMLLSKEVPPARLGEVVRGWKGTLLALQRNPYPGDLDAVSAAAGATVHDLSACNADLAEMLALLTLIDDYVTVSNTNVHLAAGVGRVARILVPRPPEWRWMQEGDESPWFPGFPVYRQPVSRDWSEPLARLREDLRR